MDFLGPATMGLAAVILLAWIVGLRGHRKKRTRMSSQSDWTDGSD